MCRSICDSASNIGSSFIEIGSPFTAATARAISSRFLPMIDICRSTRGDSPLTLPSSLGCRLRGFGAARGFAFSSERCERRMSASVVPFRSASNRIAALRLEGMRTANGTRGSRTLLLGIACFLKTSLLACLLACLSDKTRSCQTPERLCASRVHRQERRE